MKQWWSPASEYLNLQKLVFRQGVSKLNVLYNFLLACFSPIFEAFCTMHFADGKCDGWCNNIGCNWDGLDCEEELPPTLATGMISVIVLMDMQTFQSNKLSFLREVN